MRTHLRDGKKIPFTPAEETARDAEEAAEAAKPKPVKHVNIFIHLNKTENTRLLDFLNSGNVLSNTRTTVLKGKL